VVILILQGCEPQRSGVQGIKRVPDFATQAEQDFPRYKIEKKDFYGFRLMEPIDIRTFEVLSQPGMKNQRTGGDYYILKDQDRIFDSIHITIDNGLLSKIYLGKVFNNYYDADNFAKILYQKSKETYPQEAFSHTKVTEETYVFTVRFYDNKEEWKKYYIEYLDMKGRYTIYPYLFHEFLNKFAIMLTNSEPSLWIVMVEYETKLYRNSERKVNEERKKRLKDF
jgi:hypothetical protein